MPGLSDTDARHADARRARLSGAGRLCQGCQGLEYKMNREEIRQSSPPRAASLSCARGAYSPDNPDKAAQAKDVAARHHQAVARTHRLTSRPTTPTASSCFLAITRLHAVYP